MDEAPSSTRIVGKSRVAARVVVSSVTARVAATVVGSDATAIVKLRPVLLAPGTSSAAQTVTLNLPASVGVPQMVRCAEQAPAPSASNAMPGGSPVAV